jgi:hypothetical protein
LEKAIRFEKLNPNLKIDSHEQMLVELNRIVEKVAFKNNIPLDTFKRFLKILRSLRIYLRFYGFGRKIDKYQEQRYYKRKEIAID